MAATPKGPVYHLMTSFMKDSLEDRYPGTNKRKLGIELVQKWVFLLLGSGSDPQFATYGNSQNTFTGLEPPGRYDYLVFLSL